MCLISFAYKIHPKYKLILVANRDEFYVRPTKVAHWWEDHPQILGGRDIKAQGTWMAIHKNGRFAAVTNYRNTKNTRTNIKSRGNLSVDFLLKKDPPYSYSHKISKEGINYNGYNLITLDKQMVHVSNCDTKINLLNPGIYGLSNALLDTPWPKVEKAKKSLHALIRHSFNLEQLIEIMQHTETALDKDLPSTRLDYEREKALSATCIRTSDYGTCCSTAILIGYDDKVEFMEKSYPIGGHEEKTVSFQFQIKE